MVVVVNPAPAIYTTDRIKTYIEGFDEKMEGGIPEGHIVLIVGESGTMKSSIAFNILYYNALEEGTRGVYITLEQGREKLLKHMAGLGMRIENVEDLLAVVDLAIIRKNLEKLGQQTWMQIFKMYARNLKENLGYDLLVLDSLPVLETLANMKNPREELFLFFEWLRDLDITAFLIQETPHGEEIYGRYGEDFLSDGIIHLKMEQVDDTNVQRRIRCVKMRETDHSPNYYTLLFENGRFQATRVITDNR